MSWVARQCVVLTALTATVLTAQADAKVAYARPDTLKAQAMPQLPSHLPVAITKALDEKRWSDARTGLEQLVTNSDAEAEGALGMFLLRGIDSGKPDIEQGKKLLERSAQQGDTRAQRNLVQLYFLGALNNGVPQYGEAYKYIDPLATKRDPIGMYYASKYFFDGLLGVRNVSVGLQLLKDSAQAGARSAQYDLALLYRRGLPGANPDAKTAFLWFESAARQAHANAGFETGMAYLLGIGTVANTERAVGWLAKSSALGNADAMVTLAKLYETGKSVTADVPRAKALYLQASSLRVAPAFAALARLAATDTAGPADPVQALTYALCGSLLESKSATEQVASLKANMSAAQTADAQSRFETWKKSNNIVDQKNRISMAVDAS